MRPPFIKKFRIPKLRKPKASWIETSMVTPPERQRTEESPDKDLFFNRELSWLEFNRRVLAEAADPRTPLLERLRFLSIFSSNLDEFFMKRVGGLKRQILHGLKWRSVDGLTPIDQLKVIRPMVMNLQSTQKKIFREDLVPALGELGVELLSWEELTLSERERARSYFRAQIFPVLTPLAVDPGHPFPFISNLSTSLAVTLKHPDKSEPLFARVKVPKIFSPWVRVNGRDESDYRFVHLLEVVEHHLEDLFPSLQVIKSVPFRITRNAAIEMDEEDAEDLLEHISEELKLRRFSEAVRLEHGEERDPWIMDLLREEMGVESADLYPVDELLDFQDLKPLADLPFPKHSYSLWTPVSSLHLGRHDQPFQQIRDRDLLVHHPFDSFQTSVLDFVKPAVEDDKVLAIKMTLYRTGEDSPIVPLLIKAAERGKQVVCLVELKARFDEERNIYWAQALEDAGVHVVYGVVGLKTHCKTLLVVRSEEDGVKVYCHIGTGNYHQGTAKLYTDLGLFTSRPEITDEVVHVFHYLTGQSLKSNYENLLVAPINMKSRFLEMIQGEIDSSLKGRPARIIAKFNSLEDEEISKKLYEASAAGVRVDLIVRGFCGLKPQVAGLSENIRVYSVIGRFLEHSRIFFFQSGQVDPTHGRFFMGSADWMTRNLHSRVEVVVPLIPLEIRQRIWSLFEMYLADTRQVWELQPDGSYIQRRGEDEGVHQRLMTMAQEGIKGRDL